MSCCSQMSSACMQCQVCVHRAHTVPLHPTPTQPAGTSLLGPWEAAVKGLVSFAETSTHHQEGGIIPALQMQKPWFTGAPIPAFSGKPHQWAGIVTALVNSVEWRLVLTSDHSVKPSRLHTHPNCPSLFIWPPRHPQQPLDLHSTESDLFSPTCLTRLMGPSASRANSRTSHRDPHVAARVPGPPGGAGLTPEEGLWQGVTQAGRGELAAPGARSVPVPVPATTLLFPPF